MVVTFLAILELWHQGRILVRQEQLFGPIEILPAPPEMARGVARQEAEDADAE